MDKEALFTLLEEIKGTVSNLQVAVEKLNPVEEEIEEEIEEEVENEEETLEPEGKDLKEDEEISEDELDEIEDMFKD